ncbi:hypothetical protein SAMN05216349_10453 [Oribacterium sp. KHPX15]|uniref:hypothetical protein n=1 Tax=unclassified Oribacterium TaxID=2629782 RepID=UPI0004E2200A|nr:MULTISPECIES: hypothetical protein [unclassified Oribacterium]SEA05253.1 hypothetical protein SAMN05216349_10453 [Oribacterium sp. KHPX15]
MVELTTGRINQILHEETAGKEDLATILRGIYTRYMHLYEEYFSDIDSLNDDKIAELKKYNEETISLAKHYYLDIPLDVCEDLLDFEKEYGVNLLGPDWHKYLYDAYKEFTEYHDGKNKDENMKAFRAHALENFYESMDSIFRESFGTDSKNAEGAMSVIKSLFFDDDK